MKWFFSFLVDDTYSLSKLLVTLKPINKEAPAHKKIDAAYKVSELI